MAKTTVITIRLDDKRRLAVKSKCDKARISMQKIFERICDLIINDTIKIDENGISLNDDEDKHSLLMQIAVINKRLNDIECRLNADTIKTIEDKEFNDDCIDSEPEPIKEDSPPNKPKLPPESVNDGNIPNEETRAKIERLINELGIIEGVIENQSNLAEFCRQLLGKKSMKETNLSRIIKNEKGFIAPPELWEYFSAEKKGNKWVWTRNK